MLSLGACAFVAMLGGCGQKGPLVLPNAPAGAASGATAPTAPILVPSPARP